MPMIIGFQGLRLFVKQEEFRERPTNANGEKEEFFDVETLRGGWIRIYWDQVQFQQPVTQDKVDEEMRKRSEVFMPKEVLDKFTRGGGH